MKPADDSPLPLLDAKEIIARELACILELVYSIGGEMALTGGQAEILLKLPAATKASRQDIVH
ncbi:MAG TPA: hypothetical protein VE054_13060 [Blattabacteriaceae bacterium]|nr:hypothetical protein [Blattabacteriaceae bacterium]